MVATVLVGALGTEQALAADEDRQGFDTHMLWERYPAPDLHLGDSADMVVSGLVTGFDHMLLVLGDRSEAPGEEQPDRDPSPGHRDVPSEMQVFTAPHAP